MDSRRGAHSEPNARTSTPASSEATLTSAQTDKEAPCTAPRVLIVDDDADILNVLAMIFTDDGFFPICCTTTETALAALAGEPVQLVITDLRLAGSTGIELIHHVQARYADLPGIIMLTAARPSHDEAELEQLERMGVRIIAKPFDVDDLLSVARTLTGWPGQSLL